MTNEQIKLVQDSFKQVAPIAETAAQLFYARLFELDPDLELLFKGNLSEQGRKLMQMLALAVSSLDRMEQLLPVVRSLGTRHVSYGVRNKDYDTVGQALLWTLQKGLGDGFTPEVEAAWTSVYATLASACKVPRKRRLKPMLFSRRYDYLQIETRPLATRDHGPNRWRYSAE